MHIQSILRLLILLCFFNSAETLLGQKTNKKDSLIVLPWEEASFKIIGTDFKTYKTDLLGHPFKNTKNCIVRITREIQGLTGIQLSPEMKNNVNLSINCKEPSSLLLGYFKEISNHAKLHLVIKNGVTVTGLPPVYIYSYHVKKGQHTVGFPSADSCMILGVIKDKQVTSFKDVNLPDGREWTPFIVEGFSSVEPLFEIIGGADDPVINEGMKGTDSINGGFEGGTCVKVNNIYHMFPTERCGKIGIAAYFDRIHTRIGHLMPPNDFILSEWLKSN